VLILEELLKARKIEEQAYMRTIIQAKDVRGNFPAKVSELSGQNIYACYQCGKCTAGCPSILEMDILPSQIIRLVQLGQEEESLKSKTIWLCASCFTCVTRCPKGVDLAKIMESLRQINLRKNVDYVSPLSISKEMLSQVPQIALVSSLRKFSA
jgi:heterodisulfide reductase subunit C